LAARRAYRPAPQPRLTGLCSVTVVGAEGFAGMVTYLMDAGRRLWTVADVAPGGRSRCAAAYCEPVQVGDVAHSQLAAGPGHLLESLGRDDGWLALVGGPTAIRSTGILRAASRRPSCGGSRLPPISIGHGGRRQRRSAGVGSGDEALGVGEGLGHGLQHIPPAAPRHDPRQLDVGGQGVRVAGDEHSSAILGAGENRRYLIGRGSFAMLD
jgi:hypothetical protein